MFERPGQDIPEISGEGEEKINETNHEANQITKEMIDRTHSMWESRQPVVVVLTDRTVESDVWKIHHEPTEGDVILTVYNKDPVVKVKSIPIEKFLEWQDAELSTLKIEKMKEGRDEENSLETGIKNASSVKEVLEVLSGIDQMETSAGPITSRRLIYSINFVIEKLETTSEPMTTHQIDSYLGSMGISRNFGLRQKLTELLSSKYS